MSTDQQLLELQQTLYDSSNPTRRWLHCSRRDWILDQIAAHGPGCRRALEVGPGSGVYLPALAAVAEQVVAADIEDVYLARARELSSTIDNLHTIRDDITATELEPGSFDLILCSEVIEHIPNSPAALAGLSSLLAPDGTLILSTPQRYSPLEVCATVAFLPGIIQVVRLIYREPIIKTGHVNLLTAAELQRQLTEAGLHSRLKFKSGFYLPLVAEFGGSPGMRFLRWCEGKLRGSFLSGLLWTQYHVLVTSQAAASDSQFLASTK